MEIPGSGVSFAHQQLLLQARVLLDFAFNARNARQANYAQCSIRVNADSDTRSARQSERRSESAFRFGPSSSGVGSELNTTSPSYFSILPVSGTLCGSHLANSAATGLTLSAIW
jgi:hypothetical protein